MEEEAGGAAKDRDGGEQVRSGSWAIDDQWRVDMGGADSAFHRPIVSTVWCDLAQGGGSIGRQPTPADGTDSRRAYRAGDLRPRCRHFDDDAAEGAFALAVVPGGRTRTSRMRGASATIAFVISSAISRPRAAVSFVKA